MTSPRAPVSLLSRLFVWGGALTFLAALLYLGARHFAGFTTPGLQVSPGRLAAWGGPVAFDAALMLLFGLHHSVFARMPVRRWVERHMAPGLERSAFVWIASALLIAVAAAWQPVPGFVWRVEGAASWGLRGLQVAGVALTAVSVGRLGVLRLSGLDDPATRTPLGATSSADFALRGPYRLVRHPIYSGWLLLVFGVPAMSGGLLLFGVLSTLYLIVAIPLEERTLVATFGEPYRAYQRQVRWRLVPGLY
ncbi:MAG: isoprenylcysteine carboxylmethyltransferase family protein [Planctomycetota bacterium]